MALPFACRKWFSAVWAVLHSSIWRRESDPEYCNYLNLVSGERGSSSLLRPSPAFWIEQWTKVVEGLVKSLVDVRYLDPCLENYSISNFTVPISINSYQDNFAFYLNQPLLGNVNYNNSYRKQILLFLCRAQLSHHADRGNAPLLMNYLFYYF